MIRDPESARQAILSVRQAMQRGDHQAALDWAARAVSLDPDSEEPWLYLAAVSNPHASILYLERALSINPESRRALLGLQWAQKRLADEQSEQASKQDTQPIRRQPENSGFSATMQVAQGESGNPAPMPRSQEQKFPVQTIAPPASPARIHLPKAAASHRWSRSVKRFSSHWQNWIGFLLVGMFLLVALAAPLISPNNPKSPGPFQRIQGISYGDREPRSPSVIPPLGTLPGQMDLFHALVWGTRDAMVFGIEVVGLAAVFGLLFGAIAGYAGGLVSSFMMRITDAFLAFPIIAGIVLLNQLWVSVTVAAGGYFNPYQNAWSIEPDIISPIQVLFNLVNPLVVILILFSWMPYARITNAVVTTLKQAEFIQAARAIGAKPFRIILRHLIPNSVTPSIVLAARDVGSMVILQATFTFIGLGGSSTWGEMLVLGRDWILGPGGGIFTYWWVFVPATLALVLFGIGWNLLGDGLSELLDPRDD